MANDLPKILKALKDQDFDIKRTKRGHRVIKKGDKTVAVFAGTPSDWHSVKNAIADCRRAGFIYPPGRPSRRTEPAGS